MEVHDSDGGCIVSATDVVLLVMRCGLELVIAVSISAIKADAKAVLPEASRKLLK